MIKNENNLILLLPGEEGNQQGSIVPVDNDKEAYFANDTSGKEIEI